MHIEDVFVHPIKSCAGVRVDSARITPRGLEHDRRFMLVDDADRFLTLRTEPRLPFVDVAIGEQDYLVSFPDGSRVTIQQSPVGGERRPVVIWGDRLEALVLPEASEAFSAFLGRSVTLVHHPDDVVRPVNPKRAREGDQVSLADAYPLLLMGRSSVDDLSERVGAHMDMRRFRPNLVFGGGTPYMEDFFAEIRIGDVTFRGPKVCSRCVATTIDPENGAKSVEPLRTLARYRRANGEVFLGMNLVHDREGTVSVGDELTVLTSHVERAFGVSPSSGS